MSASGVVDPATRGSAPARTILDRVNPVTRLLAAILTGLVLLASVDVVSAGTAIVLQLAALLAAGVPFLTLMRRLTVLWIAAPLTAVTIALYGRTSGEVHVSWGLVVVSDGSLVLALATALRIVAIGVPAIALFLDLDPTDLADGLAQILHLPARFVLGALAAFRLVHLFADDWRALELARRARGIADRGRLRRFVGLAFALLVLAVRRGSTLATAMEARGFGGDRPRTWSRRSRLGPVDAVFALVALLIAVLAVTAAVLAGTWNFVLAPTL